MSRDTSLEVVIARLGAQGDGIAETDGGPLYVAHAVPGDRLRVALQHERHGRGPLRGRILEVLEPGVDRAAPACRHFGECGGCSAQQLVPDAYAAWKRALVAGPLGHRGFDAGLVEAPLPSPAGSRRRVRLAARRVGEGVVLGFNAARR
ncbi:MAG TPA: class I SAM-dependent RNA methyltransferase, partial [Alphaproteobacteria bacterium]|nr:class I SAM-dependent RNA methyltransferase [Alphaproteobacteria bacterium]